MKLKCLSNGGLMNKFFLFLIINICFNSLTVVAQKQDTFVKIETNKGEMVFRLAKETPQHTQNFIRLAKKRYFDTYTFNRVIKGFVIQGGETDSTYAVLLKNKPEKVKFLDPEFATNLIHQRGALAAGRDDNAAKKSFEGQFYVVDGKKYNDVQLNVIEKRLGFKLDEQARKIYKEVGGVPHLDQNYTVFGQLILGWDVLDEIAESKKNKSDQPLHPISLKVKVLNRKEIASLNLEQN